MVNAGFAAVTHTPEHVMAASWLVVVRALVLTSEWIKFWEESYYFQGIIGNLTLWDLLFCVAHSISK